MVIDTSIILAIYFEERYGAWAALQLNKNARNLLMSTVNLAETLIILRDRQPTRYNELEKRLVSSGIRFVPPDISQAKIAAKTRMDFSINLGDCFVYALAKTENCPILTLDKDFRSIDHPICIPDEIL